MSSSPLIDHSSPVNPTKASTYRDGEPYWHDSYDATPPSTPPGPGRSWSLVKGNATPTNAFPKAQLESCKTLSTPLDVTSQTSRDNIPSFGHGAATLASAVEVDNLKDMCQKEYESSHLSALRTPTRAASREKCTTGRAHKQVRHHTVLEQHGARARSLRSYLPEDDDLSSSDEHSNHKKSKSEDLPFIYLNPSAHDQSLADAILQLESEKRLLDTARARLDEAHAMYNEAKRSSNFAKAMLIEASEAMERLQIALAERRSAALPAQSSHHWDESLSVAEKVSIVGLDTARTLAYGRCACWNPECTLPNEVKEYLKSQDIL